MSYVHLYTRKFLSLFIFICTFSSLLLSTDAQSICKPGIIPPFKIPVRNISLANNVLRRGVAVSVGTPLQYFAFWPHANDANNTIVYNIGNDQCASSNTPISCEAFHNGQYDSSVSSTWVSASSLSAAGGAVIDNGTGTGDLYGTDTLQLNDISPNASTALTSFPIVIQDGLDLGSNALGLATNSTLLTAMINAKLIASRTWSLFWGLTGENTDTQMDGELLLGGYDLAKTSGPNTTLDFSLGSGCDLSVNMTSIEMNFPNGTNFEVLRPSFSTGLRMCVSPEYPIITIPLPIWESFMSYAGGTYIGRSFGINLYGELFQANGVYDGDLTLTLASGFQIRIPNDQLVVPDVSISNAGSQFINDTTREVLLNSLQGINADDIPKLGQAFLTSTYLYVDNENEEFTLWQSNPTTDENIVAVGPSVVCPTSANATSTVTAPPSTSNSSTNIGAIVGGIVGGLAFLSLLAFAIFFILRRKRNNKTKGVYHPPPGVSEPLPFSSHNNGTTAWQVGKPADQQGPYPPKQELDGSSYPHELSNEQRQEIDFSGGRRQELAG